MVDYITAQNPACKISFLTLIHRSSAWDGTAEVPNAASAVLSDYCTAIKKEEIRILTKVDNILKSLTKLFVIFLYKEQRCGKRKDNKYNFW